MKLHLHKAVFAISSVTVITLFSLVAKTQENMSFPLASMEIRFVPEQAVCPNGYAKGVECPQLDFDYINTLRAQSTKTKPVPPGSDVSLGNLFDPLGDYRDALVKARNERRALTLGQRKAAIFIFDFGHSPPNTKPNFDISVNAIQTKGDACENNIIQEDKLIYSYTYTLPAANPSFFYHTSADTIIPCSRVTWLLTAKDKSSNKTYSWTFRTAR